MTHECQTLESKPNETETQLRQLELEREKLEAARRQLAADLAALAADQDAVAEERDRLTAARAKFDTERSDPQPFARSDPQPFARSDPQPSARSDQQPSARSDQQPSAGELDQEAAEAKPSRSADDDDVFARLRALSVLREDPAPTAGEPAAEPEPEISELADAAPVQAEIVAEVPVEPAAPTPTRALGADPAAGSAHHDEESIDDYMARLLTRLNGGRGTREVPPAPAPAKPAAAPQPEVTEAAMDEALQLAAAESANAVEEPPLEPVNMTPRWAAPERRADFTAMRELANLSANSAIGASQRRKWTNSAALKIGAASALGVIGLAVLSFAGSGWAGTGQTTILGFGAILFVAGALWMVQGVTLLLRAWGVGKESTAPTPKPAAMTTSEAKTDRS